MADAKEILVALDAIDPMSFGEPIKGKTYAADGWIYRDIARTTPALWDELMGILGEENVVVLVRSNGWSNSTGEEIWRRGQVLVSPKGVERATAFAASRKTAPTK